MKEADFKISIEKDMIVVSFSIDDGKKFSTTFASHKKDFLSSEDLIKAIPYFINAAITTIEMEHYIVNGTSEKKPVGLLP